MDTKSVKGWALILGGSSGLGLATAKKLAQAGYSILCVHRDRRVDMDAIAMQFAEIKAMGVGLHSFNADATNPHKRQALLLEFETLLGQAKLKVVVHSIAKGNLKPMRSKDTPSLKNQDFGLTIDAMATSFYDWISLLVEKDLCASDLRAIAFTSEGNTKAWANYGAVSAAKAALEAIMRSMALEFAPIGIKANCIQAGVTETASFSRIPGSEVLKASALQRNPNGRLTTPEDVANAVYLLTLPEASWITGTVIKVDGGESLR